MEVLSGFNVEPLEDSMPLANDPEGLRARIECDGFLYLRGVIPRDRVRALRAFVLDHARRASWLDPSAPVDEARGWPGKRMGDYEVAEWSELQANVQMSRELWDVGDAPALHELLRNAFGRPSFLFLGLNTCRVVSPHLETTTRPHQDAHFVGLPGDFVTVWVPLGDCPVDLGPLAALPGSHRRGLLHHQGYGIVDGGIDIEEDAVWRTGDFSCGDALVLTRLAVHRALPNRSGTRLRLSADLRYGFLSDDVR